MIVITVSCVALRIEGDARTTGGGAAVRDALQRREAGRGGADLR
jgi:hypothetical protein